MGGQRQSSKEKILNICCYWISGCVFVILIYRPSHIACCGFVAVSLSIGPLSRTARLVAHTNTKTSPISTINYSTKIGDLSEL